MTIRGGECLEGISLYELQWEQGGLSVFSRGEYFLVGAGESSLWRHALASIHLVCQ